MTELKSTTTDTYQVPASSPEAPFRLASEQSTLTETDRAREDAMREAVSGLHELDTGDVDARRVEGSIGASSIAAAVESVPATQPEICFNPTDMAQLLACGRGAVFFRMQALELPA